MTEGRPAAHGAAAVWQVLIGAPLRAQQAADEQITPVEGLSALSLDALTSVAYGPEAIIVVLAVAGAGALHLVLPITIVIVVLLAVLVFSYRQVIDAYPGGGGAYAVSRANLGAERQPRRRRVAHRRLHPHRRGVDRRRRRGAHLGVPEPLFGHRADLSRDPRRRHAAQPARPRRDGSGLPAPDDGLHRRPARDHRGRPDPPARAARAPTRPLAARRPTGCETVSVLLVLEGLLRRVQRAHRRRGDRERRAAVQRAARACAPSGPSCCSA